jgi:hypothetical protein
MRPKNFEKQDQQGKAAFKFSLPLCFTDDEKFPLYTLPLR